MSVVGSHEVGGWLVTQQQITRPMVFCLRFTKDPPNILREKPPPRLKRIHMGFFDLQLKNENYPRPLSPFWTGVY